MPLFDVELHLNETTTYEGYPAAFMRIGRDKVEAGDSFRYVTTLRLEAPTARATLEMAFAAGNANDVDVPGSREYDRYGERSLSVGDVVVVHTPDGPLIVWVDSIGWRDIEDIDLYNLTIGEPTHTRA